MTSSTNTVLHGLYDAFGLTRSMAATPGVLYTVKWADEVSEADFDVHPLLGPAPSINGVCYFHHKLILVAPYLESEGVDFVATILAHELGHAMAFEYDGDLSEAAAVYWGRIALSFGDTRPHRMAKVLMNQRTVKNYMGTIPSFPDKSGRG